MRSQYVLITTEELGELKNLRQLLNDGYSEMHYANSKAGVLDCLLYLGLKDAGNDSKRAFLNKEEIESGKEYIIKGKDILKILATREELIGHTSNARAVFGTIERQLFDNKTRADYVVDTK